MYIDTGNTIFFISHVFSIQDLMYDQPNTKRETLSFYKNLNFDSLYHEELVFSLDIITICCKCNKDKIYFFLFKICKV